MLVEPKQKLNEQIKSDYKHGLEEDLKEKKSINKKSLINLQPTDINFASPDITR